MNNRNKKGFTLAEVLITLTIIGVVAALTIPSLLANIADKSYSAKRQGFATRMAQAISQMDALNTFGNDEHTSSMNFVTDGLSKVYKISAVCEFDKFEACDFPALVARWHTPQKLTMKSYIKPKNTDVFNEANGALISDAVAFRTKNGESALLWHNPYCVEEQAFNSNNYKNIAKEICIGMVIDLDGAKKGPNQIGKDIAFANVMYPNNPKFLIHNGVAWGTGQVKPSYSDTGDDAETYCAMSDHFGYSKGNWTLPSLNDLLPYAAMYGIAGIGDLTYYVLGDTDGSEATDNAYFLNNSLGYKKDVRSVEAGVTCTIKKSKW